MLATALTLLLACPAATETTDSGPGDSATPPPESQPGFEGGFLTENSAGRTGRYFVPDGWNLAPVPLLVGYHGTGGDGVQMLTTYAGIAAERGFVVIAPDSRVAPNGAFTWEVGTEPGEITEDVLHTQALIAELASLGVVLAEGRMLATGFSGGGSSGPYFATNDPRFNAYGSQHGGAFPDGMGDRMIPGWFSTGQEDDVRSPEHVQGQADDVTAAGYPEPRVAIYPGGHDISDAEGTGLIDWWLALPETD